MSEGGAYKVAWRQISSGWRIWLHCHPKIVAEVTSLDDAWPALYAPVCRELGDGEPNFAFDPPLPANPVDAAFLIRNLGWLTKQAYGWIAGNVTDYFTGSLCEVCWNMLGARNEAPLVEKSLPEGDLCHRNQGDFSPVVASERFVKLLTSAELDAVVLRKMIRPARTRKAVYEIIPRTFVSKVPVIGSTRPVWKCPSCGGMRIWNELPGSSLRTFVADDRASNLPPLFGVGDPQRFDIGMPFERACELAHHPHSRGAGAVRLGTVPDALIDRHPLLEIGEHTTSRKLPQPLPRR